MPCTVHAEFFFRLTALGDKNKDRSQDGGEVRILGFYTNKQTNDQTNKQTNK